ncbi:acyl-CoA dehydrogenase family protein [Ramlibacter sp.]|uniref:acyl-CoA dehydrogenase family protein n=1 Tax=Ramlibacter sp. TaxID=1917967 RepID=UPI003D0EF586
MKFALDEDQQQLADGARRFMREHYTADAWRAAARTAPHWRESVWRDMGELGWMALAVPESHGGLGLGASERGVLMEEFGRGLLLEPYWSTAVFGAELIRACTAQDPEHGDAHDTPQGATPRRAPGATHDLLNRIAQGEIRLAVALHEPGARYDWTRVTTRAVRSIDGGWRITGRKVAVLDAAMADRILLLADVDGEESPRVFCIDARMPGVRLRDFPTLDERRCADIELDGVHARPDDLLADANGIPAMQQAIDHALVALAAESVGAMEMLVETTIEYLKTRKQFGRPLAEFQVLRHKVADMLMALEQTRSLTLLAAHHLGDADEARSRYAAAAKAQAGQAGKLVGESAVQLHGGIGVSDELPVGRWFKRLLTIDFLLGDAAFHLKRVADLDSGLHRS